MCRSWLLARLLGLFVVGFGGLCLLGFWGSAGFRLIADLLCLFLAVL